jgi:hypothetical protein
MSLPCPKTSKVLLLVLRGLSGKWKSLSDFLIGKFALYFSMIGRNPPPNSHPNTNGWENQTPVSTIGCNTFNIYIDKQAMFWKLN